MDAAARDYASRLPDHGVYTPELVVNGSSGFVGSHAAETYRAITGAMRQAHIDILVRFLKSTKKIIMNASNLRLESS